MVIRAGASFFPYFSPRMNRGSAAATWLAWLDRQRQRVALARLDDRLLGDIAVTREDAIAESRRWD